MGVGILDFLGSDVRVLRRILRVKVHFYPTFL